MGQIVSNYFSSSSDNLETFSLLWLDAAVNATQENVRAQDKLRATIHQLKTFVDPNACEHYIKSVPPEDRIVLISSGRLGQTIVPRIHQLEQLLSVYIYCHDKQANEQWSSQHSKVNNIISLLSIL